MFHIISKEINWQGEKLTLESGKIARQSDASVLVKFKDTRILCAVTVAKTPKEDLTFFPLTVNYIEKYYSTGRYPGGFFKREAKPTEREVLISRFIDRPIRPLFPKDYFHDVNIVCQVLSYDGCSHTDILSLIGSVAALNISSAPFKHNVSAVKIGYIDNQIICNPSPQSVDESAIDLTVVGNEHSITTIESSAKQISKSKMIACIQAAQDYMKPVIELISNFSAEKTQKVSYDRVNVEPMIRKIEMEYHQVLLDSFLIQDKHTRKEKLQNIFDEIYSKHSKIEGFQDHIFNMAFEQVKKDILRNLILDQKYRVDGRKLNQIRNLNCEIDLLPMVHGSALFTRGNTQALGTVTLGSSQDKQTHDNITGITNDRFLLHYNFPPYSVGECGTLRPPGRREIGHGTLAKKAILSLLPDEELFPYTIRVVSEITESDGSSSMATVCASSLAMMSAGIPIKEQVAGIAMGLIKSSDQFAILSDISGIEDNIGDMDFKITMTKNGITAIQMDIKVPGISIEIIDATISQAMLGCENILNQMNAVIPEPGTISHLAPKIHVMKIDKSKIKNVIGTSGKTIKEICEKSQAKIDIDDTGKISIFGLSNNATELAKKMIDDIIIDPIIGSIYSGSVVNITSFGAFVRFLGKHEGLVHISEIATFRVETVSQFLDKGDIVNVKFLGSDKRGKLKLTMKNIEQEQSLLQRESWISLSK